MTFVISTGIHDGACLKSIVDDLVRIEEINFGKSPLYQSGKELEHMVTRPNSIFVGAYTASGLVGYCSGSQIAGFAEKHPIIDLTFPQKLELSKAIYVESFELLPEFQHSGKGSRLFRQFLAEAKSKGFCLIAGHARNGSSYNLVRAMLRRNIIIDVPVSNYSGTGETYHYILANVI